jgi:hypothetical protein
VSGRNQVFLLGGKCTRTGPYLEDKSWKDNIIIKTIVTINSNIGEYVKNSTNAQMSVS